MPVLLSEFHKSFCRYKKLVMRGMEPVVPKREVLLKFPQKKHGVFL